jgi:hypothetical protein
MKRRRLRQLTINLPKPLGLKNYSEKLPARTAATAATVSTAAAVTTTTAATATAISTAATAAFFARSGFVDGQTASVNFLAV